MTAPHVLLSMEEAAQALKINRTRTYALIKAGELRSVKIGRLRRVPVAELEAYVARLTEAQNA